MQKNKQIKEGIVSGASLICGIIGAVIWLSVRILSGSPYELLHKIEGYELFPPVWLYSLCCLLWSFIIWFGAGTVINTVVFKCINPEIERGAYKGGLLFLLSFFLYASYYPIMFAKESIFIASVCTMISAIFSSMCSFYWLKVSGAASLIMGSFTLWQIYIFIISFSVFLCR